MSIIKLHNITKKYGEGKGTVTALNSISLEIEQGSMVAVMGKSGCGKSTLINILGGLTVPDSGEYHYDGVAVNFKSKAALSKFRHKNIGYIVQNYALIGAKTAKENIELALLSVPKKERQLRVDQISTSLAINDKLHRYPFEMSGGECQRVAIARALVNQPRVILADEPTGSLDTQNEDIIISILRKIADAGTTVIVVTHDMSVAQKCDRIIMLKDGAITTNT